MPQFRITEAVSLRRVKKPQFLHCAATSSPISLRASPSPASLHLLQRPAPPSRTAPTVQHISDAQHPPSRTPLTLKGSISSPLLSTPAVAPVRSVPAAPFPISSTATTYKNPVRANTPSMATDMTTRSVTSRQDITDL